MKAVYKIENLITGDLYVGSSVNFTYRKYCHLKQLREGKHHSLILQNSWNKHGKDAFLFSILEQIEDHKMLIEREQYYIDALKPRYNICHIAGSPLGIRHTYEARMNMSLAHKGKSLKEMGHKDGCKCTVCNKPIGENSPRYIKREERSCACGCGKNFVSMVNSPKKFISGHNKAQLGRKRTPQQIEHHKVKLRNFYKTHINMNAKQVSQFTLDGRFIRDWVSESEAARDLNIFSSGIRACIKGRYKQCGGYKWEEKS